MFGFRTPLKVADDEKSPTKPGAVAPLNVRRSVGEWEAANSSPTPSLTDKTSQAGPVEIKNKTVPTQGSKTVTKVKKSFETISPLKTKYANRSAEALACLNKAKQHLNSSRNTKNEIKTGVFEAIERLYKIVKEIESELKLTKQSTTAVGPVSKEIESVTLTSPENTDTSKILENLERQTNLLIKNNKKIEELKEAIDSQKELLVQGKTYATVATNRGETSLSKRSTLHSIVVTSKDETETGDEVLNKVRKAVNAKDGWIKVEKVRKAKDRKIIIGLQTEEERGKIKDRLQKEGVDLTVEEVKNKDPLLILRNVLVVNTDEDVLKALRNQNQGVFDGLDTEENRVEIRYRRRTRNPHIGHIIVSVSPTIWRRAVEIGTVHIDLQRIRVEDQTPLVQCTRCLGFGHGKRYCKETADLCGHCGGPHMRSECPDWLSGSPPACRNCMKAKIEHGTQHNAFSHDCPVRAKWDDIARSTVAYC